MNFLNAIQRKNVNRRASGRVNEKIHPKDQMFTGNMERYLGVGEDAMRRISGVLSQENKTPTRVLDLACGHGRVARHLKARFPDAEIVGSDVMPHAVEFCATELGLTPHLSSRDLAEVEFDKPFDLVWSGSLMTHLSEANARKMLSLMVRSISNSGVAAWTVHGRHAASKFDAGKWTYNLSAEKFGALVASFRNDEYAYTDYEHMKDYGISLTPLSWILRELNSFKECRLIACIERGWDEHQDLIAIAKRPVV